MRSLCPFHRLGDNTRVIVSDLTLNYVNGGTRKVCIVGRTFWAIRVERLRRFLSGLASLDVPGMAGVAGVGCCVSEGPVFIGTAMARSSFCDVIMCGILLAPRSREVPASDLRFLLSDAASDPCCDV